MIEVSELTQLWSDTLADVTVACVFPPAVAAFFDESTQELIPFVALANPHSASPILFHVARWFAKTKDNVLDTAGADMKRFIEMVSDKRMYDALNAPSRCPELYKDAVARLAEHMQTHAPQTAWLVVYVDGPDYGVRGNAPGVSLLSFLYVVFARVSKLSTTDLDVAFDSIELRNWSFNQENRVSDEIMDYFEQEWCPLLIKAAQEEQDPEGSGGEGSGGEASSVEELFEENNEED